MKKLIFAGILGALILSTPIYATPDKEAMESLDTAKMHLSKKKYDKAMDEINYAISKINELLAEKLKAFIPDAPAGYTLLEKTAQGLGDAGAFLGSKNSLSGLGRYQGKDGSEIELTIASGGFVGKAAGLMNLGGLFGTVNSQEGVSTKSVRVSGYTGTLEDDKNNKTATLSIQVGEKTSVIVKGDNIKSADIVSEFAKKVDLAGIEEAF